MVKNVLLLCYMRKNFGDDLFVSMLLNRYKKINFIKYCYDDSHIEPFQKYSNLKIITGFNDKKDSYNLDDIDYCIYIGGSIFRENDIDFERKKHTIELINQCKKRNIKVSYISSNFGPYKTKEYLNLCTQIIKNIDSISFRDKYSYNMFKKYNSVSYCPDLVFSLKLPHNKIIKDSIGISVLDLSMKSREKNLKENFDKYETMLINNIKKFIELGKKVYLFSFCEPEGDLIAINRIMSKLDGHYSKNIKIIKYNAKKNSVYNFLNDYSKMEYFICTRFHSLVLSLMYKQKIFIIPYSKKLDELLIDLNTDLKCINVNNNINKLNINMSDFKSISSKKLKEYKKNAINQFKYSDKVLNKKTIFKTQTIKKLSFSEKKKKIYKKIKKKLKK